MTAAPATRTTAARVAAGGLALVEDRYRWLIAALMAVAVALILVAMRGGIGVTPDSVGYASAARNFAAGAGFTYFDGKPLVLWPIGLPLVLGMGLTLGLQLTTIAAVLNLLACAALVALAAGIGLVATHSKPFSAAIAAAVVIAQSTVHTWSQLWSEPLFIVACLGAVLASMEIATRGPTFVRLAAAIACVWAASNLRFVGVTVVPVVGIALLAAAPGRPSVRSLVDAAAVTAVAGAGTVFVFVRNYLVGGTATGNWNPSHATIPELIQTTLETIGHWLLPITVPGLLAGIGLAAVGLYGAIVLVRDPATRPAALPMASWIVLYLGILIVVESRVDGYIDERYVAPVLVPSLVLIGVALRDAWRRAAAGRRPTPGARAPAMRAAALLVSAVIVIGVVGYATVNTAVSGRYAALFLPARTGYNGRSARTSRLAQAAGAAAGVPGAISNDPEHVYWVTRRFPTYAPRSFTRYGEDARAALRAWVASGAVTTFVEFNRPQTSGGWTAASLRSWGITLSDPVAYPDGTLYHLSLPAGAAALESRVGG